MKQTPDYVFRVARTTLLVGICLASPYVLAQPNHRHMQRPAGGAQQKPMDPQQQWAEWNRVHENARSHYGQGYESRQGFDARQGFEATSSQPEFQSPPGGAVGPGAGHRPGR